MKINLLEKICSKKYIKEFEKQIKNHKLIQKMKYIKDKKDFSPSRLKKQLYKLDKEKQKQWKERN